MTKKFGRIYKTKTYDNIQVEVGIINRESPNSIYCDITCYIKSIDTNYKHNLRKFLKSIENTIELNMDMNIFNKRFIFVTDIPDTMATLGNGFITMGINLFLNNPDDFNDKVCVEKMERLVEIIQRDNIIESELFEVRKSNRKGFKNFYQK